MSDQKADNSLVLLPKDEVLIRVKKYAKLLTRRKAAELNAIVTDNPRPGRFSVLLLTDKYEIKREVAVALGTNSYNINYQTDEPMLFDIYFRAAYPEGGPAVGEELVTQNGSDRSNSIDGGGDERADLPDQLVDDWMDETGRVHLTNIQKLEELAAKRPSELVPLEFAHVILWKTVTTGASDVYLQPGIRSARISFLIDDQKQEIWSNVSLSLFFDVLRCMIGSMGNGDATKMRKENIDTSIPIRAKVDGADKDFELRLHSHPDSKGVSLVLRSQSTLISDFEKTGLERFQIDALKKAARSSNGMILLAGETGSGKTGTLECLYHYIHFKLRSKHLIEVVDTVEVISDWRDQIITSKSYTWDDAVSAALRSKPHKWGFGEIRNAYATEKAVEAAMTGHLIMATYHATTVGRTIDRLRQMGVDIQRLAASLNVIQSQILINKLCPICRKVDEPLSKEWQRVVYKAGDGCEFCSDEKDLLDLQEDEEIDNQIGYKGRTVIAETFILTEEIEDMIIKDAPVKDILSYAVAEGCFVPFSITGRMKVWDGITSMRKIENKLGKSLAHFYGIGDWLNSSYFEGERNYELWAAQNLGKDDKEILERLVSMRELALRGATKGERDTARKTYDNYLKKYKLTEAEVENYARGNEKVSAKKVFV